MTLTKKNYEAIASILREHIMWDTVGVVDETAKDLADYFATDNKNFDRTRFLQACGIE